METIPQKPQRKLKRSYQLSAEVTVQIEAALQMDPELLLSNAEITDFTSPAYLKDETIAYLFCEFSSKEKDYLVNKITEILLRRIKKVVVSTFPLVSESVLEQIFEEIVGKFFIKLLDSENKSGDYYLIRFQDGVYKLAIGAYRKWKRLKLVKPLSEYLREGENEEDLEGRLNYLIAFHSNPEFPTDSQIIIKDGLEQLTDNLRIVYILRKYWGWPIESLDPQIITLSTYFDRTPKTIRNWLKQAEDSLSKWRGAENE